MKNEDFKDNEKLELLRESGANGFLTSIDDVINWGRKNSLWPLTFATNCCGIEIMATGAPRHNFASFGMEVHRAKAQTSRCNCGGRNYCQQLVEEKKTLMPGKA